MLLGGLVHCSMQARAHKCVECAFCVVVWPNLAACQAGVRFHKAFIMHERSRDRWLCRAGLQDASKSLTLRSGNGRPYTDAAAAEGDNKQLKRMLSNDFADGISHVYAGTVRDCFAELLKDLPTETVTDVVAVAPLAPSGDIASPIFIIHVHDEVFMRFRSFDKIAVEAFGSHDHGPMFTWGRYPKVQNNAVTIHHDRASNRIEWFSELQPLNRKDGPTLATALIQTVGGILDVFGEAVRQGDAKTARGIHVLIGAAKRLVHHYVVNRAGDVSVKYRMVLWKCASHQTNLVVLVAIAGRLAKDALETDELCGTLSRLYKYLMPSCVDEYTTHLRKFVIERFVLRHDTGTDETRHRQSKSAVMVALYGDGVLPHSI